MKKFFLTLGWISIMGIGFVNANYTPTNKDIQTIQKVTEQIESFTKTPKDKREFIVQFKKLKHQFSDNKQLNYLLENIENKIYLDFEQEKLKAKKSTQEHKLKLLTDHLPQIAEGEPFSSRCKKYYDLIDDISFAYDFPTAISIATRYRESSCSYALPDNGDGPFQIVAKDYGTGEITEDGFITTVTDFIKFAKNKYERYEGKIKTNLSYTNIDLEATINFAALYNGGRFVDGIITPINPRYLLDKYEGKYKESKRYGIRPYTIKTIEREINQGDKK